MFRLARMPVVLALVAVTLVAILPTDHAEAARYQTLRKRRIAPGVTYWKIKDTRGPNRIFVLTINLAKAATIDAALAGDRLGVRERTSSMAARHGAIAAVNGDFGSFSNRPAFHFAQDGNLTSSSLAFGYNVAVSYDETAVYMDHPQFSLTATEADTGETWRIRRWNDPELAFGELGGYTRAGGSLAPPPIYTCSARLAAPAARQWADDRRIVVTDHVIDQSACQAESLPPNAGVVLSAHPGSEQAEILRSLATGEAIRVAWSFGWRGVLDAVGGTPLLLSEGKTMVAACGASLCARHPRTGVGVRADGRLMLVVVDGRQPGYSVGMTLLEFAELFRWLGAIQALNLDGGGSSTMVIKGRVVNRPSGGHERAVVNALLVLPGPDGGEVAPTAVTGTMGTGTIGAGTTGSGATAEPPPGSVGSGVVTTGAPLEAIRDGGSTGGLVDSLARGAFTPRRMPLHPDLARALPLFRSSRRP